MSHQHPSTPIPADLRSLVRDESGSASIDFVALSASVLLAGLLSVSSIAASVDGQQIIPDLRIPPVGAFSGEAAGATADGGGSKKGQGNAYGKDKFSGAGEPGKDKDKGGKPAR